MVHLFSQNGFFLALDVNSGAVHLLDELCFTLLSFFPDGLPEDCPPEILSKFPGKYDVTREAFEELCELRKNGLLFARDECGRYAQAAINSPVKALCLHIAHDCNLRCEYCFAAKGDFGQGRKLMNEVTGKAALDFLITHSKNRRNLEVDFFGGEPLMNWEVVKKLIAYGRELETRHGKNIRFTLTTNGLLLNDETAELLNAEMSNLVLSVDGRREVNDRLRKTQNGKGTYDVIVPKYKKLTESRTKDWYVRGTFTRENLDFAADVEALLSAGFTQLSVEPAVLPDTSELALRESDLSAIFAEYERLAAGILEKLRQGQEVNFFHFMLDLEHSPCALKRIRGCGSGNEYVAVTPDGEIYPCHQFVGVEEWKMGNVHTGEFNVDIKARFARANIYSKRACADCFARFYCSGGCNANNYIYEGDINIPHKLSCAMLKKRLECALMIKAALAVSPQSTSNS